MRLNSMRLETRGRELQHTQLHDNRALTRTRWIWANVAIVSTKKTMNMIFKSIAETADQILSNVNCTVGAAIQPVTKNHLKAAREFGGDAIDLDPGKGDFVSKYKIEHIC